ncbi:MAG: hypothetical protein Q9165_008760 [Trypethelium subeluteriae]
MGKDGTVAGAAYRNEDLANVDPDASFDGVEAGVALGSANRTIGKELLSNAEKEKEQGKGYYQTDVNKDSDPKSQQSALAQSTKDAEEITEHRS